VKHEKCFPRPHYKIKKIMASEKAPQEQASWHSTWNTRFWCFYHIQIDPGKKPRFGLKNKALIMERTLLWMNKVQRIQGQRIERNNLQILNWTTNKKQIKLWWAQHHPMCLLVVTLWIHLGNLTFLMQRDQAIQTSCQRHCYPKLQLQV
jgi:hypothetical protein